MAWRLRLTPFAGYAAIVIAAASLWGAALPVLLFNANWIYSVPLLLASAFPLVIYASSNPRLLFLVLMVFTAPLGLALHLRGHMHMGGAHAFSIALCDFFLVPLLVFLARDYYLGYRRDIRFSAVSVWWLALTALGASWIIIGPVRELAAYEVWRMLELWLIFLVIVNECVREKHFHYVVGALVANMMVNILVAFLQFSLKRTLGLQPLGEGSADSVLGTNYGVYADSDVFRVTGLSGHANLFAASLALLLPIYIGQMFTGYSNYAKVLLAVVSAGGLVCLGMTLSRSGWISFVVSGGIFMAALVLLPELKKRYMGLKVAMLAAAGVTMFAGMGEIIRRLTASDPGALDFRFEWVGVAWKMVQDRPLFGFGLNSFSVQMHDFSPYSATKMYDLFGDFFPVVHNIYMIVWSEQGTIGLLLFLGLHASILWIALKNLRYRGLSEKIYMISLAAACGVLGIMVDGLSSFYIRVELTGRVFWIVVGLVVAAYYWNVRNYTLRRKMDGSAGSSPDRVPPEGEDGARERKQSEVFGRPLPS